MRRLFDRILRLFRRHKGYIETVMEDHPIALYLMGKESFIEDEE